MQRVPYGVRAVTEGSSRPYGISLGSVPCSEHEAGIGPLLRAFGVARGARSLDDRRNTVRPTGLTLISDDTTSLVYLGAYSPIRENSILAPDQRLASLMEYKLYLPNPERSRSGELAASAWDEGSFGVRVTRERGAMLETLFDAFDTKNGIVMGGTRDILGDARPLVLLDYRLVPKSVRRRFNQRSRTAAAQSES